MQPRYTYTLSELEGMPTLRVGQADDLKVDADGTRVWLSRCTVADGEPFDHAVTVERYVDGRWEQVERYVALDDDEPRESVEARDHAARESMPEVDADDFVDPMQGLADEFAAEAREARKTPLQRAQEDAGYYSEGEFDSLSTADALEHGAGGGDPDDGYA